MKWRRTSILTYQFKLILTDTYGNQGIRKENVQQLEEVKAKVCKTSARLKEAENHILDMEEKIQTTEDAVTELLKLQSKLK